MASGSKQYGLIIPGKKFNISEVKRPSVFNNNSDSDDDDAKEMGTSDWIKKSFQKQAAQNVGIRRQTVIDMKKALEQDPTVYKYDEVYDEIEKKKLDEQNKKKEEKRKPRYIQTLLKKAELRKVENERRIERQIQKEREAEGEQFKDKETFVTSAYKKKLEEFNKLDEVERRQDMLEDICDVSKQQDLGGFYRHLYKTTVDKNDSENNNTEMHEVKKEKDKDDSKKDLDKKIQREKRQYRKRKSSESSSLEEGEHGSDSDTSISSSSSGSDSSSSNSKSSVKIKDKKLNEGSKSEQPTKIKQKKIEADEKIIVKEDNLEDKENSSKLAPKSENIKENLSTDSKSKVIVEVDKPKVNIWVKRTVGTVFDEALKRYFQRKAERQTLRGN